MQEGRAHEATVGHDDAEVGLQCCHDLGRFAAQPIGLHNPQSPARGSLGDRSGREDTPATLWRVLTGDDGHNPVGTLRQCRQARYGCRRASGEDDRKGRHSLILSGRRHTRTRRRLYGANGSMSSNRTRRFAGTAVALPWARRGRRRDVALRMISARSSAATSAP